MRSASSCRRSDLCGSCLPTCSTRRGVEKMSSLILHLFAVAIPVCNKKEREDLEPNGNVKKK